MQNCMWDMLHSLLQRTRERKGTTHARAQNCRGARRRFGSACCWHAAPRSRKNQLLGLQKPAAPCDGCSDAASQHKTSCARRRGQPEPPKNACAPAATPGSNHTRHAPYNTARQVHARCRHTRTLQQRTRMLNKTPTSQAAACSRCTHSQPNACCRRCRRRRCCCCTAPGAPGSRSAQCARQVQRRAACGALTLRPLPLGSCAAALCPPAPAPAHPGLAAAIASHTAAHPAAHAMPLLLPVQEVDGVAHRVVGVAHGAAGRQHVAAAAALRLQRRVGPPR